MLTKCLSLANKTAMLYGSVTYANVMKLLDNCAESRLKGYGIPLERFAAMIVHSTTGAMVCRAGKFRNVWVD